MNKSILSATGAAWALALALAFAPGFDTAATAAGITVALTLVGAFATSSLLVVERNRIHPGELGPNPTANRTLARASAVGFTCSVASGFLVLAINAGAVAVWPRALVTGLVGSCFAVGVGALLGTLLGHRRNAGSWSMAILMLLLLPTALPHALEMPAAATATLSHLPTVALADLFRGSLAPENMSRFHLVDVGTVLAWALLLLALARRRLSLSVA